ncbi:MAG: dUTP diphosphatase [Salinivirgaceae bacterium]|nr:MAG: dUTP diphosphatase [Salinivirgaceae bacterium]
MKLKVVNKSPYDLNYATVDSAGMDLHANIQDEMIIKPLQRVLIPTGLFIELEKGYEAMVRPRSGMALKYGISVLNTPGTIDADYRGEVGVILVNLSNEDYSIKPGDRIAQMVINKYEKATIEFVDQLTDTERGEGGFGHSGK